MPFTNAWGALQSQLATGTKVPNWTAANGLLGNNFVIVAVTRAHVDVDTPGAQNVQRVPRTDFEDVYNVWDGYLRGTVKRHQVRDATRFSKYIVSIWHWLEAQLGGSLP